MRYQGLLCIHSILRSDLLTILFLDFITVGFFLNIFAAENVVKFVYFMFFCSFDLTKISDL